MIRGITALRILYMLPESKFAKHLLGGHRNLDASDLTPQESRNDRHKQWD
jgi:hypothetical protein